MYIYISIYALSQVTNSVMTIFLHKNTNFFQKKKNRNISKGKKNKHFFSLACHLIPEELKRNKKLHPDFLQKFETWEIHITGEILGVFVQFITKCLFYTYI